MLTERFGILLALMNEMSNNNITLWADNICKDYKLSKVFTHQYSTVFVAELVNDTRKENITFIGANRQNSVFIPADFIEERSSTTGDLLQQVSTITLY